MKTNILALVLVLGLSGVYVYAQTEVVIDPVDPVDPVVLVQEYPKDDKLRVAVEDLIASTSLPILDATKVILDRKDTDRQIVQYNYMIQLLRKIEENTRH